MSLKPRHDSGLKEQQDCDYAEAGARGASGVEGGTYKHEIEVGDGDHHDVQEDVGRDSRLVKIDDANWGGGLELTSEVSRQYEDASILKGATSSKENSQTPPESKSMNMVPTAGLLTGHSPDDSASCFLHQNIEKAVKDEMVQDENLEKSVKDEMIEGELPPSRKGISAKALLQQHVAMDSQDWSVLMPEELVLILFKFLKPGDVLATSQTCQLWREFGENDKLWEQICKEAGLAFSLTPANLSALERRNKNSTIAYSAWKENFLKPYKIAKKFREIREAAPQVLTEVRRDIVDKMKLFNDKIVLTCAKTIYVFCALSGKFLHELVGHTENVEVIDIDKQFVVSASSDGSVKVWDVDTGSCLHTLLTYGVLCLQIHATVVVTGSLDGTMRMWDLLEGRNLRTFTGGIGGWVDHIQFDGRFVVSSSGFFDIKVWDPERGVCLHTLVNQNRVKYFKLNGGHVLSVHFDGTVKVWEVDTGVCGYTLQTRVMELQGDLVVYTRLSDYSRSAKICSISTGACLHTLAGPQKHSRSISSIGMNDKFVVTTSSDRKLKLWDIKTGLFIRDLFVMKSSESVEKMEMKEAKIVCVVAKKTKLFVLNFDTNDLD